MNGTVKWYNFKKGYGFISGEDGKDYFVHYTSVPTEIRLNENAAVTFDAVETDKGIQAQNIVLGGEVSPAAEAPKTEETLSSEEPKSEETPAAEEPKVEAETKEDTEDF